MTRDDGSLCRIGRRRHRRVAAAARQSGGREPAIGPGRSVRCGGSLEQETGARRGPLSCRNSRRARAQGYPVGPGPGVVRGRRGRFPALGSPWSGALDRWVGCPAGQRSSRGRPAGCAGSVSGWSGACRRSPGGSRRRHVRAVAGVRRGGGARGSAARWTASGCRGCPGAAFRADVDGIRHTRPQCVNSIHRRVSQSPWIHSRPDLALREHHECRLVA